MGGTMNQQLPMTFARIAQQQVAVANQTQAELKEYNENFQIVIEGLLALLYAFGKEPPPPERRVYQAWAQASYVSATHTLLAIQQLSRVGFYLEAKIVHRHVCDVLVQLAYFAERPLDAEKHFIPGIVNDPTTGEGLSIAKLPKAHKLRFDKMFKDVAPDYYSTDYRMHSEVAHGSMASTVYRSDVIAGTAVIGFMFNPSQANYLILESVAIAHGLLRWFPRVFPNWDRTIAGNQYESAFRIVSSGLSNTWKFMPDERPWLTRIAPLILWEVPSP
jgi:hypothetical protein